MVLAEVVWCCKAVISGGVAAGVGNTVYQSIPRRNVDCSVCAARGDKAAGPTLWDVAATLRWFAGGAAFTALVAPLGVAVLQRLAVSEAIDVFLITNGLFSPLHILTIWPEGQAHVARHIPQYLGGGLFVVSSAVLMSRSLTGWNTPAEGYYVATTTILGGCLVFLQFCFVNNLAVTELHLLYHSVLPRQRDEPEVDSFAGLIRFCQIWGNGTVLYLFAGIIAQPGGLTFFSAFFDTTVPDVLLCHLLFLGLFHHMQAVTTTKDERMLHHGAWVAFVPATFFSGANILVPILCASMFIWSYEPYWRAMEELRQDPGDDGNTIAIAATPHPIAAPAFPAHPAEPAEPAVPASLQLPLA
jgi:hypothetical protein